MQDRFKFRFFDKKKQKMMYENSNFSDYCKDEWWGYEEQMALEALDVFDNPEHYILMQCTGLKDKNDKLIYEGDILIQKEENGGPTKKLVIWEEDGGYLGLKDLKKSFFGVVTFHRFGYTYEVIGNIYENPELLEVSNDH